ncbi:exosome component [Cystoisospora suis]|uniref:Exosome component n=1 Tax=Cystoisospora suis TaxID=483139 RepID=A0A2C6L293_9APIC|nr:exosome component [Cystoisospora suis]
MNFSVPSLDSLLFPSPSGEKGKDPKTGGSTDSPATETVSGPQPSAKNEGKNTVRELLSVVSKLVASAKSIPSGDEYSLRTSGTPAAASATHKAAEETLEALELITSLSRPGNTFAPACRHNLYIHRALSSETSPTQSGTRKEKKHLFPIFQDFLDDLFDDVDRALAHHDKFPNTPLPRASKKKKGEDSSRDASSHPKTSPDANAAKKSSDSLFPPGHITSLSVFSSSSSSSPSSTSFSRPDNTAARSACKKLHEELAFSVRNRPQRAWIHLIDNFSSRFIPRLPTKPHAKEPLHPCFLRAQKIRLKRMRKIKSLLEGQEEDHETETSGEEEEQELQKTKTSCQDNSIKSANQQSSGGGEEDTLSNSKGEEDKTQSSLTHAASHGRQEPDVPASQISSSSSSSPSTTTGGTPSLVLSPSLSSHLHGRGVLPSPVSQGNLRSTGRTERSSSSLASSSACEGDHTNRSFASPYSYPGILRSYEGDTAPPLPHVYETELQALRWRGDDGRSAIEGVFSGAKLFTPCKPKEPKDICDTPLIRITTKEELQDLVDELGNGSHPIIAFDLEHHSFFSYRGFTCLIQMSTREKDYLIDPFPLFEHLHLLNEITANPRILKIFHGADSDIIWLQRDFSVYVVNMFDTCIAARTLALPGGASLANLLRIYCDVEANKQYQLADWRKRPLTADMEHYARSDTHYLPYIFDVMKNQLLFRTDVGGEGVGTGGSFPAVTGLEEDLEVTQAGEQAMQFVLERSRDVCLKLHVELPFDASTEAEILLKKNRAGLSPLSYVVFINLLNWRDMTARRLDRSPISIATPAHLLLLAQKRPTSSIEFSAAIRPVPATLRHSMEEIVKLIQKSLLDSEAAERAALACSSSFSPRPSPCDFSPYRSSRVAHVDGKEEEVANNKEGKSRREEEESKRRRGSRRKRKRERESQEEVKEDDTSSLSSGSSSQSDKDEEEDELLPRAVILQQAAAKSRKKALNETSFSSFSSSLQKASEEKENALHSASPEEETTTPVLLEKSQKKQKSSTSSLTPCASPPTKKQEKASRGLITAPATDRADVDSKEKSAKKRLSTPALSLTTIGDDGRDGLAHETTPEGVAVPGTRKRRRIDLPKVVMKVASTEAMIEEASFPDFLKPIPLVTSLYVPPSEWRRRGSKENSPPSPSSFPSSSRSVARRVYAELQLVEQLYLLVDHERANDLTECLYFPSLSSSSIPSATSCLLAAPSSSKEDHLHSPGLPSLESPQVHLSERLDIRPSPTTQNLAFLPSVTLPAPPPPAALLAALGESPNSREKVAEEKSAGCVDREQEENVDGEASQSRSRSKDRSERDDGQEEEEEEMDESLREGDGGREEVFIVAKQKWKRRKRKRGKGGGSSSSNNKDEDASEDSQNNSSPVQPGQQKPFQERSIRGDTNDKERKEETSYLAGNERIKIEPSSSSSSSPTTCASHQVSASPPHRDSQRSGVYTPLSTHRVSPSGGSGKSPSPTRAEGHSLKQDSNKSSYAAQVKREPSDVSNTSGGSLHKSQVAKQKQKNSNPMSWLPAAFVDRKLTAAPLPKFTGRKK